MFGKDLEIKKLTLYIKVMLRMENQMVLVLRFLHMEESMLGNGKMGMLMVWEHQIFYMDGVTYGNSTFVTGGYCGTILTSTDGITWTSRISRVISTFYVFVGVVHTQ